jgi:hypothetical protein
MRKLIAAGLASALAAAVVAVPATAQTVSKFSVFAITVHGHFDRSTNSFTFRDRLVEPGERTEVLGSDKGSCRIKRIVGHRPVAAHCRVVFFLPAGKVKVNGDVDFRRHLNKIPVVGGTRAYNGVGGKVIVHDVSSNRNLIDFTLVK